jgi:transposase
MTQPRSRVDLYAAIRRDARSGMSNRALQRKHGVGFRTVTAGAGICMAEGEKATAQTRLTA